MLKNRILLAIFALVFCNALNAQTVVIDDARFALPVGYSYSSGGSVAVPLSLNGCFSPTNTFTWTLLNDATGLPVATPNAATGTVSYFYATFINTVLPTTLPTGTYRIAIASSTTGAVGDTTQAFLVTKGASVVNAKAQPTNPLLILKDQYYFGICDGNAQTSMVLRDSSTSGGADTLTLIDDYRLAHPIVKVPRDAGGKFNLAFNPQYLSGKTRDAYYTGYVKTVSGLVVSTIGYQIINNAWDIKTYAQTKNGYTCKGDTVTLGFEIDRTQTSHLQQNYPGALIVTTWNDGSPETHTQCELLALNGKLIHQYSQGSCSNPQNGGSSSYTITSTVNNPFYVFNGSGLTGTCAAGAYSTTSAFVFSPPKAKFTMDTVVCVLDTLKFINISDPGQGLAASGGITGCSQLAHYTWAIDHNINPPLYETQPGLLEAKKDTAYAFPTFGYHDVTLFINNNYGNASPCPSHDTTRRVCVDTAKVRPDFQLDSAGLGVIRDSIFGCSPEFHVINNTKSTFCVDSTKFKYKWRVLNAVTGAVVPNNNSFYSYTHGTRDTSRAPWISISLSGKYLIELNAGASCAVDTNLKMLKYVEANGSAGVNFTAGSDTVTNCGFPAALIIDYTPGAPANVALNPTAFDSVHYSFQASSAGNLTFKWTVEKETSTGSGAFGPAIKNTDYSYQNGTDSSSKYPKIKFITAGLYKVTIFFSNSCQPKTAIQYVALRQPISVSAGSNTGLVDSVCHTANFFGITGASVSGGGAVGQIYWTMDGTGDSYFSPASGDPSTPNIFNPILTLGPNDKALACDTGYKFTITMSASGVRPTSCASFTSSRKLYVRPCVTINDTGYNTCSGTALNYFITNPGLTNAFMTWTATPIGGIINPPFAPASGSGNAITDVNYGNGIIDYAISPTKDGCPGNTYHFYDTVRPVAGTPNVTVWRPNNPAHSMCSGDRDSITITGDTPQDVFNWTSFSNQGIITGNKNGTNKPGLIADTLFNTSPAGTTDTMNYCIKTVSSYGCPGPQSCVQIIVTPGPNIAKITNQPASHATVFLCDSSCFTIKHSSPGASGVGTLTITNVGGGPVPFPTIDNDSITVICGLKPNSRYRIRWTIAPKLVGCFSSTDSMEVFVMDSLPNISLGNDIVLCDVDGVTPRTVTLTVTPSGPTTTPYAYYFSPDAPFTAQTAVNHNFTFTNRGTYKVWANVRNNVCPDRTDTLLIYAFGKPLGAAVTIAPAQSSYCQGSTITLTANIDATISDISRWEYTLSGPPGTTTILPTNVNPLVQTATQSANYKALLYSKGWSYGCKDSIYTAAPLVIVDSATVAGTITASDTVVCTPNTVVSLTLSGYRGNPSNIRWIQSTTSGTSNYGIPFAIGNPISVSVSTTTWYRAIVQNGNCTIDTTLPIKIQLPGAADIAHTGNDTILCGATNILLTGNNPVIGSGSWQMVSGQLNSGGTGFSFGLPPNDVTTTNPVNANITLPGIYKFVWSIKNLSCPGSSDAITVINRAPIQTNTISASADTVCSGTTVNFTGSVPTNGSGVFTYQWQYSTDNGATWITDGTNGSSYAYTTSTDVWVRRFVRSDSCIDYSPISKIVVQSKIVNNTVIPVTPSACINTLIPTFNGSNPSGASGSYNYAWDSVSSFNHHYANGLWVNANNVAPNYTPGVNLTDTFYVRRIVTSGKCTDTSAVAFVIVNPDAKANFSSVFYSGCAPYSLSIQTPNPPAPNTNHDWYATTGAGVRTPIGSGAGFPGYTIMNGLDSIMITEIAISTQGCKPDSISRWYYSSATPAAAFTVSADSGCANNTGANTTTFSFANTTPAQNLFTYFWDYGNTTGTSATTAAPIAYDPSITGLDKIYTVTLTATSQFCGSSTATHNITIRTRPHVLFSVSPTYQCSGIPDTFTNKTVASSNVTYAWIFGDAGNTVGSTQTNPQHTYNVQTLTTICPKLIASNECASDSFTNCVVVAANTVTLNMLVKGTDKYKCLPDTVMVYNNSVGGTSYVFDFGDGTPSVPTSNGVDSVIHVYTKAGHYVITLTGSTACGSVSTTDSVIAYGTPVVAFSINPNTTVCKGDSIHFTNLTDTATSYVWDFGNATTSGAVNPTVPYSASGTYNVQLTATRTQTTPLGGTVSCTAVSGVQTVTVRDTMPAAFTITQVGKSCLPDTLLFTNTSAITTLPINNINWNFGDGIGTSVVSPATYVYSNLGQYAVTLNVTNAGGCFYTDTQFVNVTAPVGTWVHDTGYICGTPANPAVAHFNLNANATDSITINYGDATPIVTVLYSTFVNPFTHTYSVGGTYYPNVTLKSANGCTYFISAFGPIRVDYVKASYTVNPQAQTCGSTVLSFTNTSHNDQLANPPAYTWIIDGVTYNTVNPSVTFNTTGTYNVFLKDSSVSGCVDTVATTPVYVKVNNIPNILSITRQDTACAGLVIYYTANTGISEDPITNYNWGFGNGTTGSGVSTQTIYGTQGIFYDTVSVVTSAGCRSTLISNPLVINGAPIVAINPSTDTSICLGNSINLTASSSGTIPIATYDWIPVNGGLNVTTGANVIATPTVSTKFIVTGTSANGCTDTASINISIIQPYTITINPSPNDSICLGESVVLTAGGAGSYLWSPASGLDTIRGNRVIATPTATTTYTVVGTNAGNCFPNTSASILIAVGDTLHVSLGIDTVVLQGGTLYPLNPTIVNGPVGIWNWTTSTGTQSGLDCYNCGNPIATVGANTCYHVEATSIYGCKASSDICIIAFCEASQVYFPNAFTPDGNGVNDYFYLTAVGIPKVLSLRVFNRWGQVVFERSGFVPDPIGTLTPNTLTSWNGKIGGEIAPTEVYVYTCEVQCANGTKFTYTGNVALIK